MHHADTIGGRIKALRGRHNLSQEEFAARLDISRSVLSQIEIDKIRPSVELITRITREFKADYKWLMEGDEWRNVMRMESNIPRDIMPESDEVYSMKRPLKKSLIDRIFSLEEQSEKVISPIQSFSRDKEMPLISGHAIEVYPRKRDDKAYLNRQPWIRVPADSNREYRAFAIPDMRLSPFLEKNDILVGYRQTPQQIVLMSYYVFIHREKVLFGILQDMSPNYFTITENPLMQKPVDYPADSILEFWLVDKMISDNFVSRFRYLQMVLQQMGLGGK